MAHDYAAPTPSPPQGGRPATVTLAGVLIMVTALCSVAYLIATLATIGPMQDAMDEVYADSTMAQADADFMTTVIVISSVLTAVVYLLVAVTLLILTVFNNQGRNGARIATWVVGGIGACCGGGQLISLAVGDAAMTGLPEEEGMPSTAQITETVNAHLPGWYDPVLIGSTVIGVLALGAALILLALPPSNEYFRRAKQPPQPPQDPQYPQYPQV